MPSILPKSNVAEKSSRARAAAAKRRTRGVQNKAKARPNSTTPAAVMTVPTSMPKVSSGCCAKIGAIQEGYRNFSIDGHISERATVHRTQSNRKERSLAFCDTDKAK